MGRDRGDIEFRLREFRPRRPVPLPSLLVARRSRRPFWIATAAGVAAAVVVVLRLQRPPAPPAESLDIATLGPLTMLAISNPGELDSVLARISRAALPDVRRPGGALQQLAKE